MTGYGWDMTMANAYKDEEGKTYAVVEGWADGELKPLITVHEDYVEYHDDKLRSDPYMHRMISDVRSDMKEEW